MNKTKNRKEYKRKYYQEHRDTIMRQNNETRKRNPEAARARVRKFAKTDKGRFATYKGGAKVRGLVFDITFKEFKNIKKLKCYYCGKDGYGVDRLDSKIGYIEGNIVSACSICNLMKQSLNEEEFFEKCKQITDTWKKLGRH